MDHQNHLIFFLSISRSSELNSLSTLSQSREPQLRKQPIALPHFPPSKKNNNIIITGTHSSVSVHYGNWNSLGLLLRPFISISSKEQSLRISQNKLENYEKLRGGEQSKNTNCFFCKPQRKVWGHSLFIIWFYSTFTMGNNEGES